MSEEDRRLTVAVNGSSLEQTDYTKLIGLELDEELSFECHIDAICKKTSKGIGILKNIRNYLPQSERILFYNSMIKPLFLYGCIIWTSSSKGNLTALLKLYYTEYDIKRSCYAHKRTQSDTPTYLSKLLVLNGEVHQRETRNARYSFVPPKYSRASEGGRTFTATTVKY